MLEAGEPVGLREHGKKNGRGTGRVSGLDQAPGPQDSGRNGLSIPFSIRRAQFSECRHMVAPGEEELRQAKAGDPAGFAIFLFRKDFQHLAGVILSPERKHQAGP